MRNLLGVAFPAKDNIVFLELSLFEMIVRARCAAHSFFPNNDTRDCGQDFRHIFLIMPRARAEVQVGVPFVEHRHEAVVVPAVVVQPSQGRLANADEVGRQLTRAWTGNFSYTLRTLSAWFEVCVKALFHSSNITLANLTRHRIHWVRDSEKQGSSD